MLWLEEELLQEGREGPKVRALQVCNAMGTEVSWLLSPVPHKGRFFS